jgi:hypothetical protein
MRKVYPLLEKFALKKKAITVPLLILMSIAFLFLPSSRVLGQYGVNISINSPQSQAGTVGSPINIQGSVNTFNGQYQIWFGNDVVVNNTSQGYFVDSTFPVPEIPGGNYTISLIDLTQNLGANSSFLVVSGFSVISAVPTSPGQLQEGSNVELNVTLTGGQPNATYYANLTVVPPTPLSTIFSQFIQLPSPNQNGSASTKVTFPDTAFQPLGSNTTFTGSYTVYFNMTQNLAQDQFFIGVTDASAYHRQDKVGIHAEGYQPNQNAAVTITNALTGINVFSGTATASDQGIIASSWTVPSDAPVGEYNVTITSQKFIPDSQLFAVPGFSSTIQTKNLAGEPVPQILIQARDQATNNTYSGTSGADGNAILNLEKGAVVLDAFWNNVSVGEIQVSVTGENTYNLACKLTDLKITAQDKDGIPISLVDLNVTYSYVTTIGSQIVTGNYSDQTDLSGTVSLNSTLPGIDYVVRASRYGVVFNVGNDTIDSLPATPTYQAMILVPSRTLTLKTLDYGRAALPNARIELIEQTSGIFYGAVTDNAGAASLQVTIGQYRLRVYSGSILLNETVFNVLGNTQSEIRCDLYNLQVSVKISDYFGQSIPNVNVILSRSGADTKSAVTKADGTVTFDNVIGGNMEITAYPPGNENSYVATGISIDAPTTVPIKMSEYVAVGSFLIGTSLLATLLLVLGAVILFILIEVYRRRVQKSRKSET